MMLIFVTFYVLFELIVSLLLVLWNAFRVVFFDFVFKLRYVQSGCLLFLSFEPDEFGNASLL